MKFTNVLGQTAKFAKVLIMGPPGGGKGTISERIVKDFNLQHMSSGDLLRSNINRGTDVGLRVKEYIAKGQLVPDDIVLSLIVKELEAVKTSVGWLLDGFPRTLPQAEALQQKIAPQIVINLDVPFDVIVDRLKSRWLHPASGRIYNIDFNPPKVPGKDDVTGEPLIQREDDKPQTVLARLQTYDKQTRPLLDYYKKLGLLAEFRGRFSNELWPQVHKYLAKKVTPLQYTKYS